MNTTTIIIFIIIGAFFLLGLGYLFILSKRALRKDDERSHETAKLLADQMRELGRRQQELTESIEKRLSENSDRMHQSLQFQSRESLTALQSVTEKLTKLDETNKQVVGFTEQLRSLQDILKNPKQRGILGEYYLETTLKNVLPPKTYKMQYAFPNGSIVDAVVFVKDRVIPIDAKFSLNNYNRIIESTSESDREQYSKAFKHDLKLRIDETSQYIQPENCTMNFAFMFIPHEAIYYDLLINEIGSLKTNTQDLIEYAFKKNVLIVSPTSFLAFLQTVLQGLKALEIEESAKEIQKRVGELAKHLSAYEEYMLRMGKSLGTTVNHYNTAHKELRKIDKDVTRISGVSADVEPLLVDRPFAEEGLDEDK